MTEAEFKRKVGKPIPPMLSFGNDWAVTQKRVYLEATGKDELPDYGSEPFIGMQDADKVLVGLGKKKLNLPEIVSVGYPTPKRPKAGWN